MSSSLCASVTLAELTWLLNECLWVPHRKPLLHPHSVGLEIKYPVLYQGKGPAVLWAICCHPTLCVFFGLGSPWEWRVDLLWTVCISGHQVIFWLWKHSGKNCHEAVHFKHQAGKMGFPLCNKNQIKCLLLVWLYFLFCKIDALQFYILAYISESVEQMKKNPVCSEHACWNMSVQGREQAVPEEACSACCGCQAPQTLRTLFSCRKRNFWVKITTVSLQELRQRRFLLVAFSSGLQRNRTANWWFGSRKTG